MLPGSKLGNSKRFFIELVGRTLFELSQFISEPV